MPVDPPFHVYRDQLSALSRGLALWNPDSPKKIYNTVSIGDVGYVHDGTFIRMFNVTRPWDDESNRTLCEPDRYEPLDSDHLTIIRESFGKVDHYSSSVSVEENANSDLAGSPEP